MHQREERKKRAFLDVGKRKRGGERKRERLCRQNGRGPVGRLMPIGRWQRNEILICADVFNRARERAASSREASEPNSCAHRLAIRENDAARTRPDGAGAARCRSYAQSVCPHNLFVHLCSRGTRETDPWDLRWTRLRRLSSRVSTRSPEGNESRNFRFDLRLQFFRVSMNFTRVRGI